MRNIAQHVEQVVRDELAKQATLNGVDKNEFGYAIGGFGGMNVVIGKDGQTGLTPSWTVVVSVRHKLIGYKDKAGGMPVPGVVPADEDFRTVTANLVASVLQAREQEFAEASQPIAIAGDGMTDMHRGLA